MAQMIRENWWRCCMCGRDGINPDIEGGNCPNCGHADCSFCYRPQSQQRILVVPTGDSLPLDDYQPSASTPNTIFHVRAPRRHLQMVIGNIFTPSVCADTGSDINCVSFSFIKRFGVRIATEGRPIAFRLPIKGKRIWSIGDIQLACSFPVEPYMRQTCKFYVFDSFVCDVIVGRKFLRKTGTLDLHQDRLQQIGYLTGNRAAVRSIGCSKEHMWCYLDGKIFSAVPDTGAEINLISWECAQGLGYSDEQGGKTINKEDIPTELYLADKSSAVVLGTVDLTVSFSTPSTISTTVHKLVDATALTPSQAVEAITKRLAHTGFICDTFYVVKDLRDDAILGESLLATLDAYNRHKTNFLISGTDKSSIAPFWVKKKGEGKSRPGFSLTEREQFRDSFNLECDRYDREKERIEDLRRRLKIDNERADREHSEAIQQHVLWVRQNRVLLDRYYPEYYQQVVPQESLHYQVPSINPTRMNVDIVQQPQVNQTMGSTPSNNNNIYYLEAAENPWT
ncbi:hypothetical protein B0J14DRAFT_605193 [Halenospora varia]|nr:hypothetical protein B0J14DRAFT_605193 [Halenospora varia]